MAEGGQGMHHEWGKPDPMILIIDCLPCCWGTIQQQGDDTCRRGWRQGVPEKHAPCFKQVRPHRALPEAFPRPPTAWEKKCQGFPRPPTGQRSIKRGELPRVHAVSTARAVDEKFCESFPRPPTGQRSIKRGELPHSHAVSTTRAAVPFAAFAASATLQSSPRTPRAPKAFPHRVAQAFPRARAVF